MAETIAFDEASRSAQGSRIFALDVGTRSVIGVVGERRGDVLHVLSVVQIEHTKRAMIDGQIEDIAQVVKIAGSVKEQLERELNIELTHVCVAAAGRSLKTQMVTYETELNVTQPITRSQVNEWELAGVDLAHKLLFEQSESSREFTCVGYSIVKSFLDDYQISTLTDHRGSNIKIEMIATFLPTEVIESLYEVTGRIGLTVSSLTLEPIAAMNAIIPQELRLLNLALVDIGAGTSDIAISNNGSVTAYTMVTLAGDEVSEALVQKYLVDFNTAELIKHSLSENFEKIEFQDILGFSYEYTPDEIFEAIESCALHLCEEIANAITRINGKAPAAVFLVGGGSRLVKMAEMLSKKLELPMQKVAVGGSNYMKKMLEASIDLTAAEYATPMGIAITAMNLMENSSITVTVNAKAVTLFKSGAITAMDALLMSGLKQNQLIGRSGQSVTFTLNGERIVVRGGHAVPARIMVNGRPASLTTPVSNEDELDVVAATTGDAANPRLSDYIDTFSSFPVIFNGMERFVGRYVTHNGEAADKDAVINNLDEILVQETLTIKSICEAEDLNTNLFRFLINGHERNVNSRLNEGDKIEIIPTHIFIEASPSLTNEEIAINSQDAEADEATDDIEQGADAVEVEVGSNHNEGESEDNGDVTALHEEEQVKEDPDSTVAVESEVPSKPNVADIPVAYAKSSGEIPMIRITLNGRRVALPPKEGGAAYQYFDMLNFVDIDPTKPKGNIVLLHNGRQAEYLTLIQPEDVVDIHWDSDVLRH